VVIVTLCISRYGFVGAEYVLRSEPRHLVEIAGVLKKRSSEGDIMIARKPHLAYLAGLKGVPGVASSADEYIALARKIGARYIVYSDREASIWPGLKCLRDPGAVPKGLNLILRHAPTHTMIYELADT